jgi:hypothetical protein
MDLNKWQSIKGQYSTSNPSHNHHHQTQQLQIPHQVESKLYTMISIEQKDP